MPEYDVLVTDSGDTLKETIEYLRSKDASVYVVEDGTSPTAAAEIAARTEVPVLIVGLMHFHAPEILRLHGTRLIIRAGIGYDEIDVEAASAQGIWVANVPDYCVDEVADHTILLLAAAMRRFPFAISLWRERKSWNVAGMLPEMHRMRGKQLGIIGFGRIGQQVAARAQGFGWDVVATDPHLTGRPPMGGEVPLLTLEELLSTSDAITLHCPLSPETHHLIDANRLSRTPRGVVIVNTSRGGVVDLEALHRFIADGHVSVAALDVLDGEPKPDLTQPLLSHPNVIVTPHVAWRSTDASRELCRFTAEEALRFLEGHELVNVVNPDIERIA